MYMNEEVNIESLIGKYINATILDDERLELVSWIAQSKENELMFQQIREILLVSRVDDENFQFDAHTALEQVKKKIRLRQPIPRFRNVKPRKVITLSYRWAVVAAIFLMMSGTVLHRWISRPAEIPAVYQEVIVPLGSRTKVVLPDGSQVNLNAGSTLRYPSDYGQIKRDIYLAGEGYFKVTRQAGKPFTVHTALSKIRALGTEFNVKAYPDEDMVETTLIKGEVAVEKGEADGSIDRTVFLKPGQKLSVTACAETVAAEIKEPQHHDNQSNRVISVPDEQPIQPIPVIQQLTPDIAAAKVSWKERNWRIECEPLQDLVIKLDRRYDVSIEVDDLLKNYRFTGTIKDESLEQVLHAMQLTAPIRFRIEGKMVYIHADPKKMKKSE